MGLDLSLQKKIIAAGIFKSMGDRHFKMFPLLNAANQVMHMEATGQLLQVDDMGVALPMNAPQQILQTQAAVAQGTVQPAVPTQSHDAKLADEVKSIKEDVKQLLKFNNQQHRRIQDLENHIKQTPANPTP